MAHSFAQIPVPPGGKGRQYEIKWESKRGGGGDEEKKEKRQGGKKERKMGKPRKKGEGK